MTDHELFCGAPYGSLLENGAKIIALISQICYNNN